MIGTALARLPDYLGQHVLLSASALGLGDATSGELYQHALEQANRELGRVSTQLAVRNKKLAVRAKFFDTFGDDS